MKFFINITLDELDEMWNEIGFAQTSFNGCLWQKLRPIQKKSMFLQLRRICGVTSSAVFLVCQ